MTKFDFFPGFGLSQNVLRSFLVTSYDPLTVTLTCDCSWVLLVIILSTILDCFLRLLLVIRSYFLRLFLVTSYDPSHCSSYDTSSCSYYHFLLKIDLKYALKSLTFTVLWIS
jgi:hypothetical protein